MLRYPDQEVARFIDPHQPLAIRSLIGLWYRRRDLFMWERSARRGTKTPLPRPIVSTWSPLRWICTSAGNCRRSRQ